ncbi:hypothetical protein BDL97_12G024600 [Sphagnum fallax]|nr:hypothetical protein BDL97_12G024600 [Sphagnum fallax]
MVSNDSLIARRNPSWVQKEIIFLKCVQREIIRRNKNVISLHTHLRAHHTRANMHA